MRILFVTPFNIFPPYCGGGQRTYHLLEHFAKKHEVYLVLPSYKQFKNLDGKVYEKKLRKLGVKIYIIHQFVKLLKRPIIEHLNPFLLLLCFKIVLEKKIDLIICDYPWAGTYALPTAFFLRKPFLLIEHNIEYLVKKEVDAKFSWLMKILEGVLLKVSKAIVVVCKQDKKFLVKQGIRKDKIVVVENGFDSERFYPNDKARKIREKIGVDRNPLIFFCGKLDYPPNKEAVYTIRWKILPKVLEKLPDARFLIVGGGYKFNMDHEAMIFTGPVNNIEDYLNASDVVIVPITKGGGTRIKILEAIACGKIVVTTSKGAEGLVNELTKPFLRITDDWDKFSDFIVKNIGKRKKVPKRFVEKYSWKKVYKKIDDILRVLV